MGRSIRSSWSEPAGPAFGEQGFCSETQIGNPARDEAGRGTTAGAVARGGRNGDHYRRYGLPLTGDYRQICPHLGFASHRASRRTIGALLQFSTVRQRRVVSPSRDQLGTGPPADPGFVAEAAKRRVQMSTPVALPLHGTGSSKSPTNLRRRPRSRRRRRSSASPDIGLAQHVEVADPLQQDGKGSALLRRVGRNGKEPCLFAAL